MLPVKVRRGDRRSIIDEAKTRPHSRLKVTDHIELTNPLAVENRTHRWVGTQVRWKELGAAPDPGYEAALEMLGPAVKASTNNGGGGTKAEAFTEANLRPRTLRPGRNETQALWQSAQVQEMLC